VLSVLIEKVSVHPAGRVGKVPADPRMVQVWPGEWHRRLADPGQAIPPAPPRPEDVTTAARIRGYLATLPAGQWATRGAIASGAGITPNAVHKNLLKLCASGTVAREWAPFGAFADRIPVGAVGAERAGRREVPVAYGPGEGTGEPARPCFVYKIAVAAESAA
jgi:hypothetical protein